MLRASNDTVVTEFILVGLSQQPRAQAVFFGLVLVGYLISFLGNSLLILLSITDPRLHTPMYFFLCVLSMIDLVFTSNDVPQVLANCFTPRPTISFSRCLTQMYVGLFLISTECILLAIMAYDRFAAICQPLHYMQIMSLRVCVSLVAVSMALAFVVTLINMLLQPTDFCGQNIINHFVCELVSFLKLACSDTYATEMFVHVCGFLILIPPFTFIVVTYGRIGLTVVRMRSTQGRKKAFSTCSSHLTVVSIFYGTIIVMYLQPQEKYISDKEKIISVAYGVVTPMLNPLIYSLRNRDVKQAFWKLFRRKV